MRMRSGIYAFVAVMILAAGAIPAFAQQVTEHHLIRPFPGAVLHERSSVHQNFDAYDFQVKNPQTGRAEKRTVKGEYRRLRYHLQREDESRNTTVSRVEYFVGIDPPRLQAKGYGMSVPVAPNDTPENKAKNRRVELVRLAQ